MDDLNCFFCSLFSNVSLFYLFLRMDLTFSNLSSFFYFSWIFFYFCSYFLVFDSSSSFNLSLLSFYCLSSSSSAIFYLTNFPFSLGCARIYASLFLSTSNPGLLKKPLNLSSSTRVKNGSDSTLLLVFVPDFSLFFFISSNRSWLTATFLFFWREIRDLVDSSSFFWTCSFWYS